MHRAVSRLFDFPNLGFLPSYFARCLDSHRREDISVISSFFRLPHALGMRERNNVLAPVFLHAAFTLFLGFTEDPTDQRQ
ncbi:hypothetical protein HYPSUDRAFT_40303 [Hypholoma sublateritium FD-334 SS-4]|uniref:Uncharacterized protein n=1 Tax=Hypholoma sublateritium (strain FD-334 SS-4) TaxID=945553 RepID=A0A0D2L7M7_HYPSF|nr:hypothetical protein HYPSUDRAFT_40303 [Hypholoma sublateritium FD-334 SS-4]